MKKQKLREVKIVFRCPYCSANYASRAKADACRDSGPGDVLKSGQLILPKERGGLRNLRRVCDDFSVKGVSIEELPLLPVAMGELVKPRRNTNRMHVVNVCASVYRAAVPEDIDPYVAELERRLKAARWIQAETKAQSEG